MARTTWRDVMPAIDVLQCTPVVSKAHRVTAFVARVDHAADAVQLVDRAPHGAPSNWIDRESFDAHWMVDLSTSFGFGFALQHAMAHPELDLVRRTQLEKLGRRFLASDVDDADRFRLAHLLWTLEAQIGKPSEVRNATDD